jgi:hypothetical protein
MQVKNKGKKKGRVHSQPFLYASAVGREPC